MGEVRASAAKLVGRDAAPYDRAAEPVRHEANATAPIASTRDQGRRSAAAKLERWVAVMGIGIDLWEVVAPR